MVSTLLETMGFALVVAGCALITTWLALVVAGIGLVAAGYAIGRDRPSPLEVP